MHEPLTADQQRLVEQAFALVQPLLRGIDRRYHGRHDFASAVALRLCEVAPAFDPALSPFRRWALSHARYACADLVRESYPVGQRRPRKTFRGRERAKTVSLDAPHYPGRRLAEKVGQKTITLADLLGRCDPPTPLELDEAARRLIRGLTPGERDAVWETLVEGRLQKDVGAERGLCESEISRLRTNAIWRLRYADTIDGRATA